MHCYASCRILHGAQTWGVLQNILYVDVAAGLQNFDFHCTYFCCHLPPISIPISYKKHPILLKLDAFYSNLLKIHPIYVNSAPSSVMKIPDLLTEIHEKCPKGRHIYIYHVNVRPPWAWCKKVRCVNRATTFRRKTKFVTTCSIAEK